MKLVYSSNSLNNKINQRGELEQTMEKDPSTLEELVMQIDHLSKRVKQLEVEQAWSQKQASSL